MTLRSLIALAFGETLPRGDLDVRHFPTLESPKEARLLAREDFVLAGRDAFEAALRHLDPRAEFRWQFKEGDLVLGEQVACWIKADARALLGAEAIALDLIGRACGIATFTRCYVREAGRARVVGPRVLTPGLVSLEAGAIAVGGGLARIGDQSLYLGANHARALGSLARALELLRPQYSGPVVAECTTLAEVDAAVAARVARVVLVGDVDPVAARGRVPAVVELEAGGHVDLPTAARLAKSGVDFVRVEHLSAGAPPATLALALAAQP